MTAESRRASFFSLVGEQRVDGPAIEWVEIPLFQRDYAQGRETDSVRRIRADFLDALRLALVGDDPDPVGLDFVYGGVEHGTLQPLDGQQRLTTLFLLHWFVASRSGNLAEGASWTRFSYATRQSARMFCASLAKHSLPEGAVPSDWIADQPWYLFVWRHDPTIQSMIVMLDAIDERFRDVDASAAWARLTNAENPAIWFLLLPLSGLSADGAEDMRPEQLYIKMNSRGKPLTEFENFKAHFEKSIQWSERADDFALKADTTWSDLLWHVRGEDDLIDDEFLRYIEFVTEVCEWRDGRSEGFGTRLGLRTSAVFGEPSTRREEHLDFLFKAFDVWRRVSIPGTFVELFGVNDVEADTTKVRLFFRSEGGAQDPLNLFELCCRSYGETRGRTRVFTLGQSLVLHAVLLHLIEGTPDFPRRVRILRNLIEASINELRPDRMPKILEDVESLIRDGSLEKVTSLNQAQAEDEKLKAAFLESHPSLCDAVFALEDHELLRGSLGAFELDASHFEARAVAFRTVMSQPELWPDLLAALLAVGEYQRQRTQNGPFLFGTESKRHEGAWRDLLTGPPRNVLQKTRAVLAEFLDKLAASPKSLPLDALRAVTKEYLDGCTAEGRFDWRYYMVKYPSMREKGSSTYFAEVTDTDGQAKMGYSLCMLKPGYGVRNSNYRDPYLLAIWRELGDTAALEDKWFTGYESEPRRLPLAKSGATIRCVPAGFELTPPPLDADATSFAAVCVDVGADADNLVRVQQVEVDGCWIDTTDRVQLGADIVRSLVAAGL